MYKELEKYKELEGCTKIFKFKIYNSIVETKKDIYKYNYPLGDLITDYIKHLKKPYILRKYYHNSLTKIYKRILNLIIFSDMME